MAEPKSYSVKRINANAQAGMKRDIIQEFTKMSATVTGIITRYADGSGKLSLSSSAALRRDAGNVVMRLFTADGDRDSIFAPDGVTALAPYPRILNKWYARVVSEQVRAQQSWLKRNLPDDLYSWLAGAKPVREDVENPYLQQEGETLEAYKKRAQELRIFRPNPLAEYEPMHTWVDPNGYRLDDRIWNAGDDTRKALDKLIADSINSGMSASRLAKLTEQFLVPDRAAVRTKKPYGSDASYYAMRLARTEIARAANQAAWLAASQNPYVGSMDIARSPNGDPTCKVCPTHASIDIGGNRVREPYDLKSVRVGPFHPQCQCHARPNVTQTPAQVTADLRQLMESGDPVFTPQMNPAAGESMIMDLIGRALMQFVLPGAA